MESLHLPSGLNIAAPMDRLIAFCREEYDFYDGVLYGDPNRIEPVDVLATVSVNSFINNATAVRKIQRGLAEKCELMASPQAGKTPAVRYDANSNQINFA